LGLGLAIMKYIAEAHGGQVTAHSEGKGKGAQFLLHIPLEVETAFHEVIDQAKLPQARRSLKVLVVDDSPDNAEILKVLLKAMGHQVVIADSAKTGKEAALRERPNLILADLGMPDVSGYEMMEELRTVDELKGVPAIAVSGLGMVKDVQRAFQAGFQAYITKPVDSEQLREKIDSVVGK